ncbi:MAG: SusC/RagA family TonB-linked outer membrane protein [Gemmatimonadetes bacterium]|nr:SusC/RagA family TonB-linked outer membrane protein [Gemmatimonadota bacterium]
MRSNRIARRFGLLATAALLWAAPEAGTAQATGTVTGTVTDVASGRPLAQAQVHIPALRRGAQANGEGRYLLLNVPAGDYELRVELIGYASGSARITVPPGGTVTQSFQLSTSAIALDELVVTATGQQRTREVANAVGTLDVRRQLEQAPEASLMTLLQSKVPGVTIRQSSGSVAAASSIKIRGNTSLGLDNTPLIYVDGARVDNSNSIDAGAGGQDFTRLNDLDPDNIASIEVVKGPAAATLYGTEASAGVIRITTKRGLAGRAVWSYRTEQGVTWDPTKWWSMSWNPAKGVGLALLTGAEPVKDTTYTFSLLEGDQFFPSPFRTGYQQSYGMSVRGGSDNVTYYVSGDYLNQDGVTRSDGVRRYNARANFDAVISDKLQVSVSNGFVSISSRLPTNDNSLFSLVGNALGTSWQGRLLRADPTSGGTPMETCYLAYEYARATGADLATVTADFCDSPYFVTVENSNDKILNLVNTDNTARYTGSLTATWNPFPWMTNRATVGMDQYTSRFRNIFPVDPDRPFGSVSDGEIDRTDRTSSSLTLEGSSAVRFQLRPALTSVTTVGFQFNRDQVDITSATGRRFPAGSPSVGNSVENEAGDAFVKVKTLGLFVQEQVEWGDELFVTPAVRFDDNSAFGANLGLETYPRVGVSWVASNRSWFPGLFDQFRLRGAWGQSGKQPGPNDALALLNVQPVAFRNTDILGFTANRPGNPDLKPETGTEIEVGFDASLLSGRLSAEFTYFDKKTRNAVVARPDALSLGFPGDRFVNVGEITNKGVEVALQGDAIRTDALTWTLRGSLATLDNKVTDLPEPIVFGSQRHQQGLPFGAYYDRPVTIGTEGQPVVAEDRVFLGQPTPTREGSFSSSVTLFERVTVFALLDYQGGHQLLNGLEAFNCGLFGGGDQFGSCPAIFEVDANGNLTDQAKIKDAAAAAGTDAPFIYDADFIKLRNVSVRFDLPASWVGRFGVSAASLTVAGENLFTWTKYPGTDPEANFAGSAQVVRQQLWTLPQSSRFVTRFTFTF